VNCCRPPRGRLGIAGVTAIETRAAAVTVMLVEPEVPPEAAVTVVAPIAMVVANPELLIVIVPGSALVQATEAEMSSVLPSL